MKDKWIEHIRKEDLPEDFQMLADQTNLEHTLATIILFQGELIYYPKLESILRPARNRMLKKDWNEMKLKGAVDLRALKNKYDLSTNQIRNIVDDHEDQKELFPA